MAAAYAALVSLLNTVEQIQNHPQLSTCLDHCQIELLREKVYFFLDFIESYSSHVDDLESRIATAAHAAEDAFESHVVCRIRACYTEEENRGFLLDLQKVIVDMDLVKEKVLKVKEERGVKYQQPTTANSSRSVTNNGEAIMVGFGGYLDQLLDLLTGNQSGRQIISIVGMGGIGKTTLAKNTFENSIITRHFDVRAWVSVSNDYNLSDIFLGALSHLKELTSTIEMDDERDEYRLGEQLYKGLTGRRYLIVLDDVWSVEVWDKIRFYFPDNGNRSRLIFTTRLSDVAAYCGSCCVRVNLLDECECWDLFCVRVFGEEDCPLELEQIGREIAKMCRGLPLSITVIGGLLQKSAKTVEYWHNVLENIKSILSSGEGDQCLNVLYSSYSHLPAHLKPCFLYMGTFEEDREIPVPRITKLWVAEGFLKPKGTRVLEEVAEDCLKDLVDRNLVLVGKYGKNGEIRSVYIHDLLTDLSISLADKEKFFSSARVWYTSEDCLARDVLRKCKLRFFAYSPAYFSEFKLPSSISFVWNLQTLIFQGRCQLVNAPAEIWEMSQLRHVVCNSIRLPDPPPSDQEDDVCVLRNLQTLVQVVNFRWTEEACKRIPNIKKLCVVFDDVSTGYEDCLCLHYLHNLGSLQKLESLNMRFPFCISRYPVDLLNKRLAFPTSLNKLRLRNCSLTREDLARIGSLPHLQVLELEHSSFLGGEWSTFNGEFPCLKFLRIDGCDVVCWAADTSAFRVLEKLVARDLWQLQEIPSDMGEINTLNLIRLHHCSESAAISALEIKKEQESFGNDSLNIEVNISCFFCSDSFWVRVKVENLPIDIIRFRPFGNSAFW